MPTPAAPAPAATIPAPAMTVAERGATDGVSGGVSGGAPSASSAAGSAETAGSGRGASLGAPRFDAAYLHNPKPAYPLLARRRGEEGRVLLKVEVSAAGLPEQVRIAQSSGHASLDEAALNTVRNWRFVPAQQGGTPVAASVLVPILFKLEN